MVYPDNFEHKIGFDEVRQRLLSLCLSTLGEDRVRGMRFLCKAAEVRELHRQVDEMARILSDPQPPLQDFHDMRPCIHRIKVEGTRFEEREMPPLRLTILTLHSWVEAVRKAEDDHPCFPSLSRMADGVFTFHSVARRIEQILDQYGNIRDTASAQLAAIRSELRNSAGSVSRTLGGILKSAQAEGLVEMGVSPTMRDGRLVIPVPPAMKRRIRGIVHDESATGKTVFIEPQEVVEANNRIRELEAEEKREVSRILTEFTAMLRPNVPELLRGMEFLADVEFVRAKSLLAGQQRAVMPDIADKPLVDWTLARHPLLEQALSRQGKKVVPLDIRLDATQRILVISGPNAGGKSVCLKTVGLLQYMLQCGMPIPVGESSRCGIFRGIFIDIGDEQSIDDDLSTYSSHLLRMKVMMKSADSGSLLLVDEFGGGTEPAIGGAIAEAVLMRFVRKGAFGVITTHYQNLKNFAANTPGVVSGAMLYDRQKMEALFQLQIGHPGSSFAVEIARKIGIPEDVIADATDIVGKEYVDADKYLLDITRDKRYWEAKRQTIQQRERQMRDTLERYEREIAELQAKRKEIILAAKAQAEQIIQDSNAVVENTIREIKEAQAEKEKTRTARRQLDEYRQNLNADDEATRDEGIERKMRQIEERRKRKADRKREREKNPSPKTSPLTRGAGEVSQGSSPTAQGSSPLKPGDSVRLAGQNAVGTIVALDGKQATVLFGMMHTLCKVERLERATPTRTTMTGKDEGGSDLAERPANVARVGRQTTDHIREKHLNFHQEIDVRGMRGDEALTAVSYFIDDAILVGASNVRILHGTGSGILRNLIRQYLSTVPSVRSAHDEHVQFGGAGITVVEL